jgi:palmitoyl-protein thioesterase
MNDVDVEDMVGNMHRCMSQDPYNLEGYLAYNPFLPDLNNERATKNWTYRDNLASLERLVLFKFSQDVIVVPRDSSWFGFFNGQELVELKDSDLYKVGSETIP